MPTMWRPQKFAIRGSLVNVKKTFASVYMEAIVMCVHPSVGDRGALAVDTSISDCSQLPTFTAPLALRRVLPRTRNTRVRSSANKSSGGAFV